MIDRLWRWLVYTLLASLAPFWIFLLICGVAGKPISVVHVLAAGELLLVSCGLAASGIGDLSNRLRASRRRRLRVVRWTENIPVYCNGIFFGVVFVSAVAYAVHETLVMFGHPYSETFVAGASAVLFICTVICAGCCVGLNGVTGHDY
jgi:hypothetical protein